MRTEDSNYVGPKYKVKFYSHHPSNMIITYATLRGRQNIFLRHGTLLYFTDYESRETADFVDR